jgi:hypothetical protein
VAKKKSKTAKTSKVSKKVVEKTQPKDSMLSKVEVKKPSSQERISKIVGTIFIFLGIVLIGYGIYTFVKFNKTPQLDETLDTPSLSETQVITSSEDILIKGTAEGFDEVFVYVDNEEVARVKVDSEGVFEYAHPIEDEGVYAVSVAGVRGFPKRYISLQSDMKMVEVDRTDPVLTKIEYPKEVGTESFTLIGNVEPNAEVTVTRGTDKYVATCNEQGDFVIAEILLDEGPNVFGVSITDEAGNEVQLDEKVKVTYSADSDVNGNAVTDEIPVAAGELEEAMQKLLGNNLMILFGLLAMVAFFFSFGFVFLKYKRKEE